MPRLAISFCFAAAFLSTPASADDISVVAGTGRLQAAIDAAPAEARLLLQPGVYKGAIRVEQPLSLIGGQGVILDGGGQGRVLTVDAPNVRISGLTIVNSGTSLATEDSAIFVTERGDHVLIENNRLEDNLIGIYLKGPEQAQVIGNIIRGSLNPHMNDRGNGIHIWNATGALIAENRLRYGRDGIFVMTSLNNIYRNNHFEDMRFAVHYMYTHHSELRGNQSLRNHSSYALMFSDYIKVIGNYSDAARDRGLFLNAVNYSDFEQNVVRGGTEKCLFIYNANFNRFRANRFEACEIGIHFTAGSEKNTIFGNSFIDNRNQVKYVGTRHIEWSFEEQGNYWSDNPGFDLNHDGIADRPYRPNDLVDQIIWRYPLAKLLLNSPATQLIRWAQAEFPALHPGGVTDSAALMGPPL